jgi:signal transduction histidine kinase
VNECTIGLRKYAHAAHAVCGPLGNGRQPVEEAQMFDQFLHDLTEPNHMVGHINYFLLIVSMLMRRMFWLRVFAIGSGSVEIVYRSVFVVDPVSVVWEALFVLVNVVQLVILWIDENHHRFDEDEMHFVDSMPASVERQALKRLLAIANRRSFAPGERLITEGEAVKEVLYLTSGIAQIEANGRVIAVCRPGDYLGEMSYLTGAPASATVVAAEPMRVLAFEQKRLHDAVARDASIHQAMETGLNRNLVGKLVRANLANAAPRSSPA